MVIIIFIYTSTYTNIYYMYVNIVCVSVCVHILQWFIDSHVHYFACCSMYRCLRRDSSLRLRLQVVDCKLKSKPNNRSWLELLDLETSALYM